MEYCIINFDSLYPVSRYSAEEIMREIKNYVKVQSLEEAYQLNQKKSSCILAGMLWTRLGASAITTAIDLSDLALNTIEETDEEFSIGAMTTLRTLEMHDSLNAYCQNAVKDALKNIVGVQFRNMATIGGSLWGRFGFSDVLTVFLCLDTYVELYKGGIIPLSTFVQMEKDRDILVRIHVKKKPLKAAYSAVRLQSTDFPALTSAVSLSEESYKIVIGARPGRARLLEVPSSVDPSSLPALSAASIPTSSNNRGSSAYRTHLIKVLTERLIAQLGGR